MRRAQHVSESERDTYIQAGCATGYLCRRTEEELQRIGATTGGVVSARELGVWMGRFFLSQSQKDQSGLDSNQRLPEMRGDTAQGYALPGASQALYVRPRGQRTLSADARERIAEAQRKRWRLAKAKSRGNQDQRTVSVGKLKPGYGRSGPALKSYWAKMTPAQRSREMSRRRRVADAKQLGKNPVRVAHAAPSRDVPHGFWQSETAKLLAAGPRPRAELMGFLLQRAGKAGKKNALVVAISAMKRKGMLTEADGVISMAAVTA